MKRWASLALLGLAVSVASIFLFSIQASGQESYGIPSWIKKNAGWWSSGQIGDSDFVKGIQYMIDQGILHVTSSNNNISHDTTTNSNSPTNILSTLTGGPKITTNKSCYSPGENVAVSGSGFPAKQDITLYVEDEDFFSKGAGAVHAEDVSDSGLFGLQYEMTTYQNAYGLHLEHYTTVNDDGTFSKDLGSLPAGDFIILTDFIEKTNDHQSIIHVLDTSGKIGGC